MGGNVEEWVNTKYHIYEGGIEVVDDLTETLGSDYYILKVAPSQEAEIYAESQEDTGNTQTLFFDLLVFV